MAIYISPITKLSKPVGHQEVLLSNTKEGVLCYFLGNSDLGYLVLNVSVVRIMIFLREAWEKLATDYKPEGGVTEGDYRID